MLNVDKASLQYRQGKGIKDISFTIKKGDCLGLVGANGAGKSTLLEIIATVLEAKSGELSLDGENYRTKLDSIRKKIGYVPQDLALFSSLTVYEELAFWHQLSPIPLPKARIDYVASIVGLTEICNMKVEHLSGGMKRKLNLAVALLHEPELLILDEPTVAIDIQSKLEIISFLKEWSKDKMLIIASHDMEEIEMLCDQLLLLDKGEIQFYGTMTEVVERVGEGGGIGRLFTALEVREKRTKQ